MIKKCLRLIMTKQINYFTTKCKYIMLNKELSNHFLAHYLQNVHIHYSSLPSSKNVLLENPIAPGRLIPQTENFYTVSTTIFWLRYFI